MADTVTLVGISGSLRKGSYNSALLRAAASWLAIELMSRWYERNRAA